MAKLRILLSCSYGFSTSILVKKMSSYFLEQGYDFIVDAQSEVESQSNVDNFDVILIGPQVRYLVAKFEKIVNGRIPIYVMDSRAYGMQDVGAIVEQMLDDMELMVFMKDKEYHLLESPYFNGGVKVKFLNQTCAQFPNIDLAINYIKKTCYNEKQLYSTIDLIKTDGSIEQVDVFDD